MQTQAVKSALKAQYGAGLAAVRQAIKACPDEMWAGGPFPREYWRVAVHVVFYAHLYARQGLDQYVPWPDKRMEEAASMFEDAVTMEPISKEDALSYLDYVAQSMDGWVDDLDLERQESGFHWYKMTKLEHQLLNVRHIQEHAGQLSGRLLDSGLDFPWFSRAAGPSEE